MKTVIIKYQKPTVVHQIANSGRLLGVEESAFSKRLHFYLAFSMVSPSASKNNIFLASNWEGDLGNRLDSRNYHMHWHQRWFPIFFADFPKPGQPA